jgi:hypothetical protein
MCCGLEGTRWTYVNFIRCAPLTKVGKNKTTFVYNCPTNSLKYTLLINLCFFVVIRIVVVFFLLVFQMSFRPDPGMSSIVNMRMCATGLFSVSST